MINMNRKDFENCKFTKSELIKTYRNGSEDYRVTDTCPDCGGRGYLTWTSVDQGRCWKCCATGKVRVTIHVSDTVKPALTKEQFEANIKAREEKTRKHWLDLGFKRVNFELAEWAWKVCDVWFNSDDYYRIVKETDKAYLMEQVCDIENSRCYSSYWVPKKAVTFKEAK